MKTPAAVALLMASAVLAGCGDAGSPGSSTATADQGDLPPHVVVLAPDQVGEYGPDDADWIPGRDDVTAAERLLAEVVRPDPGADQPLQPLEEYVRQYAGVGGDQVAVNGLCDDSLPWQEEWVLVFDGGACFWNALIADGQVVSFSVNGLA